MKNFLILCFFLVGSTAFAQSNLKINLIGNADYSFTKYTYNDGQKYEKDQEVDFGIPLGYSFELGFEYQVSERSSIGSGIRFGKHNITPRLRLPPAYGTYFEFEGNTVVMILAYLAKHEINTFSLPLTFKYYFETDNRFSYFATGGVEAAFQYKETEFYKDQRQFDNQSDQIPEYVYFEDNTFQLFGTSVEVGFGMTYELNESTNLIFQTNANILEYRRGNEKFKKNGTMIWKETFLLIGQASLGIGLQKAF